MSAIESKTRPQVERTSKSWVKVAVLTFALAILAFAASPNGPLGGFWRPSSHFPPPTPTQLPLFILLNVAEVLTFGLGISFLVFGYSLTRAMTPVSKPLARAAHVAIGWLLANWWLHDSLHVHVGMDMGGLLAIEYGFHLTLMIAGVILAYFFVNVLRR